MKMSLRQFQLVLSRIRSVTGSYSEQQDVSIEVTMTQEDPGNGILVDCVTISATTAVVSGTEDVEHSISIEIYPENEKLEPRATEVKSYKVKKTY